MVSTKSLGIALIALGIALPVIAYAAGRVFNMEVASYGGPPNQGAMVLAYLVIQGALAVGACLALVGVILIMMARGKPLDGNIKKEH
jgi:hypothetical protein